MVDFTTYDAVILADKNVSIGFSATDGIFVLNDAIVVRQAQYDAFTPADIADEEQRRWNEWIAIVNPPEEVVIDG